MPSVEVKKIDQLESGDVFVDKNSGIYFLHLKEADRLVNDIFVHAQLKFFTEKYSGLIHGFCAFTWSENRGAVRYFTPWHGRDEDYVTGSMQRYLTPLAFKLFGVESQEWTQRSHSGGLIRTVYEKVHITLSGECSIGRELN